MLVVNAEAERFTILFPIKIALSILAELSVIFSVIFARLFPSSAKERIRILLIVVSEVSAEEKNADNPNRKIKITICMTALESNDKFTPFKIHILRLIYLIFMDFASAR